MVTTDALVEACEHVAHGHGHMLLVGAPGSGKSTTLRAIEAHAAEREVPVRRAGASQQPHPKTDTGDPPTRSGIMIVDDIPLLTTEDLERCLQTVTSLGATLVASIRPGDLDGADGPLLHLVDHARKIVLEPWSESEVQALLQLHPEVALDSRELAGASGGLPWLVVERIEQAVPGSPGDAASPDGVRSTTLTRLDRHVLRLVRDLPDLEADLVLAIAAGYPSHGEPAAPALRGLPHDRVRSVSNRLWHTGLVTMHGTLPEYVRDALLRHTPARRLMPLLTELVDDLCAMGASLHDVAQTLVGLGLKDARLAETVASDASRHLATRPDVAAELYATALSAGGEVTDLAAPYAEALALSGDLSGASRALTRTTPTSLSSDGVRVALTLAVLGGQPRQAAKIARWGQGRDVLDACETACACAALALAGVGDSGAASALLARGSGTGTGPPLVASPLPEMAEAVLHSVGRHHHLALPTLVRVAASAPAHHGRELLPDLPATLAAVVALHCGDLAIAESVLADAGAQGGVDGDPDMVASSASRVNALQGWVSMLAGRYQEAHAYLEQIDSRVPRDQPWAWGLRLGLARRQDDVRGLAALWPQARSALVGYPVDLYSLLPLGEIGLAAARMHEPELAAPAWGEALALLAELGDPPLWSAPFHWYAVQAAVLTDRPDALAPHARALVSAGRTHRVAATYAAAGRAWVAVLGRDVDPAPVIESARALAALGQPWEGSRLAGHGAARSADRKDAALLLECARDLLHPPDPDHSLVLPAVRHRRRSRPAWW